MTIYILGDYHGKSLEEFLQAETPTEDDKILSLGDFDTVDVIEEYLSLKNTVGEENVIEVGGNHDIGLQEGRRVSSRTIKTPQQLLEEYEDSQTAKNYFEELLEKTNREFAINDFNSILTHSGLTGRVTTPDIPEKLEKFTYRLWEEEHFKQNFDIMEEKDYDLMIRGHEHYTEHAFRPDNTEAVSFHLPEPGEEYNLDSGHRHIITNGAWMDKNYAQIDPEDMNIKFKQL